ncbi:hypothetical protein [Streptomyces sp. NRRL F-2580]|uniref:hypothetical protein n=1 Tax=Streptomyces sp. NRRL F-2580 TaxID=1463841 RepID=UPI00131E909D|nr:hypothetical protein [Streptomyces sp. NRRL F-2580]
MLTIASALLAASPTRLPLRLPPANLLSHQGGWGCSAASAALPFVLRLAAARHGGRRSFLQDEDVRTAVGVLLSR